MNLLILLIATMLVVACGPVGSGAMGRQGGDLVSSNPDSNGQKRTSPSGGSETSGGSTEVVMFGAGCFWGIEVAFRRIEGVIDAQVGYSGGHVDNPTYELVRTGTTGHAEVVQVEFDPGRITFDALLEHFWAMHDPTQVNRQGPDVGTQYRSAIFATTPEQLAQAHRSKAALEVSGKFRRPIATQIERAGTFHRAEEYHQRYLEKRGLGSCGISNAH
ncbi:MAG: peptide-methionine (S)-S-oxide reductase MsrA [Phycisphaeraceae bacterium]|nr:peptide-methionine (S)-S-oxide reductase MsrA [Phycisphaeraceae bacterium]